MTDEDTLPSQRVTVSLIPKAWTALDGIHVETGETYSALINRAILIYTFITEQLDQGRCVQVHDPVTSETVQVVIF